MPIVYADRVRETSSSTAPGTGAVQLIGSAPSSYRTFASAFPTTANNPTPSYCIVDPITGLFETGFTASNFDAAVNQIVRADARVLSGSNGVGTRVNFTNGNLDVFSTIVSDMLLVGTPNASTSLAGTINMSAPPSRDGLKGGGLINISTSANLAGQVGATGSITLSTGATNAAGTGAAGSINITAGGGGAQAMGGVTIRAGNATGNTNPTTGGNITIQSGQSNTGTGGSLSISSGVSAEGSGAYKGGLFDSFAGSGNGGGGLYSIQGGAATQGASIGGAVRIRGGASVTASGGTNGYVTIQAVAGSVDTVRVQDDGTSAQLGFFNVTPVLRPATSITGTAPVINSGTALNTGTTFEGYTLAQVVTALKALGLLT